MNREQAINYLISSGFTHEQVGEVVRALTYEPTTKNDLVPRNVVERIIKSPRTKEQMLLALNSLPSQEPTTKNDLGVEKIVDVLGSYTDLDIPYKHKIAEDILNNLPSVTPQLSVPEVTALAEWTTKLTKASEDAYNKGYEAGMKAQEPRKGHWIEEFNDIEGEVRFTCSSCGKFQLFGTDFCYHCGSDNREVEE